MIEEKTVLIVEDEDPVFKAICGGLERSTKYKFSVERASSPEEYVANLDYAKGYSLVIADLHLSKGPFPFWGLRVVLDRAQEHPGTPVIVYSAYPDVENVVKAIQFGAHDFISKQDSPPHELAVIVERFFELQNLGYERRQQLDELSEKNAEEWKNKYGGQFIVLMNSKVKAHGKSRLQALLAYGKLLEKHPDWPEYPDIIQIPLGDSAK